MTTGGRNSRQIHLTTLAIKAEFDQTLAMKVIGVLLISLAAPVAMGATNLFNITISYSGDSAYLPAFQNAEAIWEQIIPSYIDGHQGAENFDGLMINATIESIDGPGNILGSAGPTEGGYDDSGYLLATVGTMRFDSADIAGLGSNLTTVILHEMGHVLGLGTLWTYNGVYSPGSGQYTGENGLAGYRAEFLQPLATYVPVELGGGAGTADGHWDEVNGGAGLTGKISVLSGRDLAYELMTGWLNTDQPYFISDMSRGSLRDLGYNAVMLIEPVPEASSILMGAAAMGLALVRRKRG